MSKKGLVLEEIWPELENGITRVINISNENRDFSYDDWMKLYVYNSSLLFSFLRQV